MIILIDMITDKSGKIVVPPDYTSIPALLVVCINIMNVRILDIMIGICCSCSILQAYNFLLQWGQLDVIRRNYV